MKKFFCSLFAFAIFSVGAYCDTYLMWGGDFGYANMAGNNGFYAGTFFDTQYYPFDGSIGVGLDLKLRIPFIRYKAHEYLYGHYQNKEIQVTNTGVDFIAAPTLSLRLASFSLKAFPLFAYSIHSDFDFVEIDGQVRGNVKEPYIGGGAEIGWFGHFIDAFLTYSYGKLIYTKEKYFSIGFGVRFSSRIKSLQERKKEEEEKALAEQKRQQEYAEQQAQKQREYEAKQALMRQQEQERLQAEQERAQAETAAIESGSVKKMIDFVNQYGYSENINLAIERGLSNNKNQPYKELTYVGNPYSFERGSVYYCSALEVTQWLSEHSFLAEVNGKIIYVETSNIKNVKSRITHTFLKANGVYEYNSVSRLNIVPKFTLMLLDDSKTDFD